ncbi:Putative metal ABC transporter substrate-binding protein Hpf [Pontiella desulfatans]|uniref:Metal ABC transporter substrate-binding protein Hpf n=1 Tax=Pontiella desulfatans TaxID=2750659 RepID=A0A6C2UBR8_PONDE|nr:metal ABC transporter substrate-binding protein [Pontiella desulfatans]VGO17608.1 Putative metal ABC transporter substrate-binding protein Hpf [Pontiella desulfatans]
MFKKTRFPLLMLTLSTTAFAGQLKVVATTADLASIAREITGDLAKVDSICTGKQDPHHLQARPKYVMMARGADLWIRTGMELEVGWEMPVIDGSRNRGIRPGQPGHLDASAHIHKLEVPEASMLSRAMGDVHAQGNPHYLIDPENAKHVAADIAARLARLDPKNEEAYKANAVRFQQEVDRRMEDWKAKMEPFLGKPVVTYHKSWIYFCHRFGIRIAIELEPKPGIPPSPTHLTRVVQTVQAEKIGVILQEPWYSTKAADRVAEKTGARVVVAPTSTGGDPAATDYFSLIDLIVQRLAGE